mgnify:CR=1 FL=1
MTLNPPFFAFSTFVTRSGAMSFGGVDEATASRSRAAVYGASSVDGSAVWTFHVAVDASSVYRLPAFARLTAASTPDS